MLTVLWIIAKHWRTIAVATVIAMVVSSGVSLVIPAKYVSSTAFMTLGVAREITSLRDYFAAFGEFGESFAILLRGQKNLVIDSFLRSDGVTGPIVERFDLVQAYGVGDAEQARKRLRRNTRVEIRDEGVIYMSVEDRSAERAYSITEAYLALLDSALHDLGVRNARESVKYLEREIEHAEQEIAVSDSVLCDYLRKHGMYDVDEQLKAMLNVVTSLSERLSFVDLEKRMLESSINPGMPDYERINLEWKKLREQLLVLREHGAEPSLFPSFKELPAITAGYVHLVSKRKIQEFVLGYLRVRLAEARVASQSDTGTLRIIDPPRIPEKRAWPKRKQIVLFSTAAAFFWILLLLLLRERIRDGTIVLRPAGHLSVRSPAGSGQWVDRRP